jgi:hypothetical protein
MAGHHVSGEDIAESRILLAVRRRSSYVLHQGFCPLTAGHMSACASGVHTEG